MLRTEWRALFHLGYYDQLTATEICERSSIHKTKVSKAVRALEVKRYLRCQVSPKDQRKELLHLTRQGQRVYDDLNKAAREFDKELLSSFKHEDVFVLRRSLRKSLASRASITTNSSLATQ